MEFDERTDRFIATLLLPMQKLARAHMVLMRDGMLPYQAKIICGTRTWAEQDALYAQGRTKPGKIVTKARGGQSNHNFGIAYDIGIFTPEGRYVDEDPHATPSQVEELYLAAGEMGERVGLEWGGRWKTMPDNPHFQYKSGLTVQEMAQKYKLGQPII